MEKGPVGMLTVIPKAGTSWNFALQQVDGKFVADVFLSDWLKRGGAVALRDGSRYTVRSQDYALLLEAADGSEVAQATHVAVGTVRNQLHAIFAKTGTHRQGELVALLARVAILP